MQAGWRNGCTGTQSAHRTARTIRNGTTHYARAEHPQVRKRHDIRIESRGSPRGRKQREVGGDHGSRKGAPTNTKNQGDASTSADNEPLRADSPPVPPTRDDRPTIRLLSLLLSLPRTTTSDHPRAIFPPVPQTRQRPTDHARAISLAIPPHARDYRVTIRSLSLLPPPKRGTLT